MSLSRSNIARVAAEFLGTALLTIAVLSISKSSLAIPYFIATTAGLAFAMGILVFGNVSGAHFNPAITLGLFSIRKIKAATAVVYVAAQLLGGVAAYYLFTYFINQTWENAGEFAARTLVAEATGGFVFSLGVAAALFQKFDLSKRAALVSLSLVLAMLVSFIGSGGIVNPAVALGARAWVLGTYGLGPVLGAIIGFNLYSLLFVPVSELVGTSSAATVKSSKSSKTTKSSKKK
jgi:aquaporin Z